jgi:hypothetical protein
MPTDDQIQALRNTLERYTHLPRHKADAHFLRRLRSLQQWEVVDMRRRHASACASQTEYQAVLDYYLSELHQGLPLDGMIERGPQGLEHARRMNKSFSLFANAMEFSVLSAVLQDRLTGALDDKPLTADYYAEALLHCDDRAERVRRLELLVELGHQCAPHIRSRMIYTGFKLLKGMFRSVGLAEIHSSLDVGFRQLRDVSRLAQILATVADLERKQLEASLASREAAA